MKMNEERTLENPGSPLILLMNDGVGGGIKIYSQTKDCRTIPSVALHQADFACGPDGFIFKNRWGNRGEPKMLISQTESALNLCLKMYWENS